MDVEAKTVSGLNFEKGSVIAQRYEICERLGAGGVGMVYRAIDRDLDEEIALKLLLPHLAQDETVFRRFRNEVLVARSLSHPNIVRTHDMGRAEGGYSYISMEYVNGVSLKDRLVTHGPGGEILPSLGFEEALSILYQVISGVAYAHGKGVIHRDLKPANVMLSKAGEVKLADFGTARIMGMDTTLTQTGQVIGTPDYMSPEQIRGEQLDPSCDIYALGIVAFELATGHRPFVAESSVAVAFKHLNDPLPSFSVPGRTVPLWFEEIVRKAAAKKKSDRFASVMEFAAAMLDYAPQLSVQSTFFSVDRTLLRPTGTQSVSSGNIGTHPPPTGTGVNTSSPSSTPSTSSPSGDFRFELGSSVVSDDEGWRMGTTGQIGTGNLGTLLTPAGGAGSRGTSIFRLLALSLAFPVAVFTIVGLGARIFPEEQKSLSPSLASLKEAHPNAANVISLWLGVEIPERVVKVQETSSLSSASSSLSERESLQAELEGKLSSSSVEAASSSSLGLIVASSSSSESPQKGSTSSVDIEPIREASSSSSVVQVIGEESSQAPVVPLSFTGSLFLRDGGKSIGDGSVALDKLPQLRWTTNLTVSGTAPLTTESLKSEFAVNVFDLRKSVVVAKLKPEEIQLPSPTEPFLKLSGAMRGVANGHPVAGSFRLDLIRAGEVISSADLILYKAALSEPPLVEESVKIVTGSSPIEPNPVPTPVLVPPNPEVPGNAQLPIEEIKRELPNGLPVAKGHEGETILQPGAREVVTGTGASTDIGASPQPSTTAVTENFGGWIRVSPSEGAPEEQRAMILNLQFDGVAISGNATVAGYDPFTVTGKVFARGMELELRNGTFWLRLTSGPRDRTLRGLYSFPALQRSKGKWEVSRSN